jgi:hypothetical protein
MPENGNGNGRAGSRGSASRRTPTPSKGKYEGLKGKVAGIPVWVIIVGVAVIAYIMYKRSQSSQPATSQTDMSGNTSPYGYGTETLQLQPSDITLRVRPAPIRHHKRKHHHTPPKPIVPPHPTPPAILPSPIMPKNDIHIPPPPGIKHGRRPPIPQGNKWK